MFRKIRWLNLAWVGFIYVVIFGWPVCFADAEPTDEPNKASDQAGGDDGNETDEAQSGLALLDGKIRIGLVAETILSYIDVSDESDEDSGDVWDAYIGALEVNLNIELFKWLSADLLGEVEDIGKQDESATASMSEAFVTLMHPKAPVYLIGGIRVQPFGVFEDRMISGTLTEELYEIVEPGVTMGFKTDFYGIDFSLTAYRGQTVIENLEAFKTHEFVSGRSTEDGTASYIINLTTEPIGDVLLCSVFYHNEPGDGQRNETLGAAVSYHFFDFVVDAEYLTAIQREPGQDRESNLESAWVLGLAFHPIEVLQVAARYEQFDDDRGGQQDEVVANRYLGGLTYSVTEHVTLSLEYRHTDFERQSDSASADEINECKLQLAVEF